MKHFAKMFLAFDKTGGWIQKKKGVFLMLRERFPTWMIRWMGQEVFLSSLTGRVLFSLPQSWDPINPAVCCRSFTHRGVFLMTLPPTTTTQSPAVNPENPGGASFHARALLPGVSNRCLFDLYFQKLSSTIFQLQ